MKCDKSRALMNAYIDNYITDDELVELNEHLEACEACTIEFEELKYMKEILGETQMKPLPKDFEKHLHEKLLLEVDSENFKKGEAASGSRKSKLINMKKWSGKRFAKWGSVAVAALLVIGIGVKKMPTLMNDMAVDTNASVASGELFGTRASDNTETVNTDTNGLEMKMFSSPNSNVGDRDNVDEDLPVESDGYNSLDNPNAMPLEDDYKKGRVIIQTASLGIDVENFDQVEEDLKFFIEQRKGYLANESVDIFDNPKLNKDLKQGHYTIKVPVENFEVTLDYLKNFGNLNYYNINAQDVTKNYRDLADEIENLKVTEERLREILNEATDVEDILNIENELSRVRGNINAYTKQIKSWEALADFSTIDVTIYEVASLQPQIEPVDHSVMTQAKNGFIKTINNMIQFVLDLLVWIVAYSPIIVILVIIGLLGRHFYKKNQKTRKNDLKKEE